MHLNHWECAQESEESDSLGLSGGGEMRDGELRASKGWPRRDFDRLWDLPRFRGWRASELRFVGLRNCGAEWPLAIDLWVVKERMRQAGPVTSTDTVARLRRDGEMESGETESTDDERGGHRRWSFQRRSPRPSGRRRPLRTRCLQRPSGSCHPVPFLNSGRVTRSE
jgi:hypothetical protein